METPKLSGRINFRHYPSPAQILITIASAIFATEFAIMVFFLYWPFNEIAETLIDATLLTSILLPILYYFFHRPFMRHIRDLKAAEEDLVQFATVIDQGMDIIIVTDKDGNVSHINPAAQRITGCEWGQTVGKSVDQIQHGLGKDCIFSKFSQAISSGREWRGEFGVCNAEKDFFSGIARISPVKGIDGSVVSYVCVGRDVSAEKLAQKERESREKELNESEERWRLLTEMAPDPIIVHDGTKIIYANKAAANIVCAKEPGDLLGASLRDFVHPDDLHMVAERMEKMARTGAPVSEVEYKLIRLDKTIIDVGATSAPITYDRKRAFQVIMRDATERKRAEAELRAAKETAEAATKLKDKFVSITSHDLKEPLNSILGFVQLMRLDDGTKLSERSKSWLDVIETAGNQMNATIEEILSTVALRTGAISPNRMFHDAHAMIAEALPAMDYKARAKGVSVINEVPHKTRLYADKTLFKHVVQNLISNAIKFSNSGGSVTLFVPKGRPSTIGVSDSGAGVRPEFLANLFKYDARTSSPGTAGEHGTGLGLPFVNEIMTSLGGEISVETSQGNGSTFFASFPRKQPTVLLVENQLSLTGLIQRILGDTDVEFVAAIDNEIALQKIAEKKPDLIIAELNMPDTNGFGLIKRLKAGEATKNIPVLALIGPNAGKDEGERCLELGADDFISKSSVESDLLPRVRKIIS